MAEGVGGRLHCAFVILFGLEHAHAMIQKGGMLLDGDVLAKEQMFTVSICGGGLLCQVLASWRSVLGIYILWCVIGRVGWRRNRAEPFSLIMPHQQNVPNQTNLMQTGVNTSPVRAANAIEQDKCTI